MPLETELRHALAALPIAASRLFLTTPGVTATAPMIRGVFGAALRAEDETAYQQVFVGGDTPSQRVPTYLLRPASAAIPDPLRLLWHKHLITAPFWHYASTASGIQYPPKS
jgi:hypothetical protein